MHFLLLCSLFNAIFANRGANCQKAHRAEYRFASEISSAAIFWVERNMYAWFIYPVNLNGDRWLGRLNKLK